MDSLMLTPGISSSSPIFYFRKEAPHVPLTSNKLFHWMKGLFEKTPNVTHLTSRPINVKGTITSTCRCY